MFGQVENIAVYLKKKSQKWMAFVFGKLSQNMCLFNIYILIYRYVRCDCKLWNAPWCYCVFSYVHILLTTIHDWIIVSSPKFHRLYVWLIYTFWYINLPNVTAGYGRFSDLISFFGNFNILLQIWNAITSPNLYKWCDNIVGMRSKSL